MPARSLSAVAPGQAAAAPPRFYGVQILRGLAAILVVLHHLAQSAEDIFPHPPSLEVLHRGASGVDIFFPISGFVMFLTASAILNRPARAHDWQHFAWRRFLRVAPPYWGFTVLKLVLLVAAPSLMLHYRFLLWNTVAAFLFLPALNYMGQPEPPLVVGWTLAYEAMFYAIVTSAIAFRQPLLRWCAGIIVAASVLGLFLPHRLGGLTYLADPIELEFLAGMLIAACAVRLQRLPLALASLLGAGALGFLLLYPTGSLEFMPMRAVIWGIPGALIVLAAASVETRLDLKQQRRLLLLGDASYALYLTHTFVVPLVRVLGRRLHLDGPAAVAGFILLGLALCVAVAVAFHLYIELPLLARLMKMRPPWSLRSAGSTPLE